MDKYDLIIVGAGCAGVFAAYEYRKLNPTKKILIVEKGKPINKRVCPKRTTGKCVNCKPCNITTGFSGAGAFSDGKISLCPDVGGELADYIGYEKAQEIIKYVDTIYLEYGADKTIHGIPSSDKEQNQINTIRQKAIKNNLKLVECPVRHLGTEESYAIYQKIQNYLIDNKIDILFDTKVEDLIIDKNTNAVKGILVYPNKKYYSNNVIIAVGREGSEWFKNICDKHSIASEPSAVDIGVRVEVRNEVMQEINNVLYEGKFIFNTPTFDDKVRTFCQNPSGEVSIERYENNLITVNGHSYKHATTNNTNLALLVSQKFTQPFNDSIGYGKSIAKLANMIGNGTVLVQRYGDFKRNRRSTAERISRGNIVPTLKDAVAGDLSLVLPYRITKDIEEMIEALNGVAEGFNSDETLLYGVECKFYNNKVLVNSNFQTNISGLFAAGDGAGITRGIAQANANGIVIAQFLSAK